MNQSALFIPQNLARGVNFQPFIIHTSLIAPCPAHLARIILTSDLPNNPQRGQYPPPLNLISGGPEIKY